MWYMKLIEENEIKWKVNVTDETNESEWNYRTSEWNWDKKKET